MPRRKSTVSVDVEDNSASTETTVQAEDTSDLTPIQLNMLRQEALADINHPLHAMFQCETMRGTFESLEEQCSEVDGFNLPQIRQLASQVAGHCQKIMLWVDRMNWNLEHSE